MNEPDWAFLKPSQAGATKKIQEIWKMHIEWLTSKNEQTKQKILHYEIAIIDHRSSHYMTHLYISHIYAICIHDNWASNLMKAIKPCKRRALPPQFSSSSYESHQIVVQVFVWPSVCSFSYSGIEKRQCAVFQIVVQDFDPVPGKILLVSSISI